MTIKSINGCIGCEECVKSCPCDVIRINPESGKAVITYPADCQICHLCQCNARSMPLKWHPRKPFPLLFPGADHEDDVRTYAIVTALVVFIALPLLIYASGDVPRRTLLKESLSILTLLCFYLMLSQFFMARSNTVLLKLFNPVQTQRVHKVVAYGSVGLILLHP